MRTTRWLSRMWPLTLALSLLGSACGPGGAAEAPDSTPPAENNPRPPGRTFSTPYRFQHDWFATQAECEAAQRQYGLINCFQWATFFPDGTAEIIVTDIINRGTYGIEGNTLHTYWPRPMAYEVPERIEFTLSANESSMVDDQQHYTWKRTQP